MSSMKTLVTEIEELLDNTNLLCNDIAFQLSCPVNIVYDIVEARFWEAVEPTRP